MIRHLRSCGSIHVLVLSKIMHACWELTTETLVRQVHSVEQHLSPTLGCKYRQALVTICTVMSEFKLFLDCFLPRFVFKATGSDKSMHAAKGLWGITVRRK